MIKYQFGVLASMRIVKSLRLILSFSTLVVTALSVLSYYLCYRYDLLADFPMTLIGVAVVFPIVFSISGAYKRRETALKHYATIKAFGRAIYLANRDWLPNRDSRKEKELKKLLQQNLSNCRDMFHASKKKMEKDEKNIYINLSKLSLFIKEFRSRGMGSSEVSRCNQYLSKMIAAFESMKHIYQYRTPRGLRAYSKIFVHTLPIVYGPYFAFQAKDMVLENGWNPYLGLVMPILFSVVLISLDNIQDHLENPFDLVGEDDVKINAEKFVDRLDL
jgi:predicted membrane chloride channel (bestrophin family)